MNIGIVSEKDADCMIPSVLGIFAHKDIDNVKKFCGRRFLLSPMYRGLRDFKADAGLVYDVLSERGEIWYFKWHTTIIGLGKQGEGCRIDNLRDAAALLPKHIKELSKKIALNTKNIGVILPDEDSSAVQAIVEGFLNGLYEFNEFKTKKEKNPLEIDNFYILCKGSPDVVSLLEPSVKAGEIIAGAVHLARDLGNTPANILTPIEFVDRALFLQAKINKTNHSFYINRFNDQCLERKGMNAILAVGKGSENNPHFIEVIYEPSVNTGSKPIILIGKGLTFDSGGINLKPSDGMLGDMKFDMAGAATVLAVVKAAAELVLSTPVIAIIPLAENKPSATSLRPGDIIKSYSGKTIEVVNTDAEGRLLLADACSYALKDSIAVKEWKEFPAAVITIATLTGACVIAAGNAAAGLMGNDPALVDKIKNIGELVGEKVQTFELFPEYRKQLKSDIADIKNIGGSEAGTITAAMFVEEFLKLEGMETPKWAHLDIAGTAWMQSQTPKKNYFSPGATGWGVRLLIEFLRRNWRNYTVL